MTYICRIHGEPLGYNLARDAYGCPEGQICGTWVGAEVAARTCTHPSQRWAHHPTLGAMVRTCTDCGKEFHYVGMDAWHDTTREVEPPRARQLEGKNR